MRLFHFSHRLPLILQAEANECGLACLAMIACYHGKRIDIGTLRNRLRLSAAGTSLQHLLQSGGALQLQGRPLKLELHDLDRLVLPVILHWDLDHYVVLKKVKSNSIIIHDPAVGVRRYQLQELSIHFTGVAIEFYPVTEFVKEDLAPRYSLRQLLPASPVFYRAIRQIFLLSLLLQLLALLTPLYLQLAIDQGINKGDHELIAMLGLLFFTVVGSKTVLGYFRGLLTMQFSNQLGFQLVGNTFDHLLRLPLSFFEKREMGDIVSRFSSLETIKQLVTHELITIVVDGIFSCASLVLLFMYSPLLAWISLAFVTLIALVRLASIPMEKHRRQEVLLSGARQQSRFMETIRGVATTKNYGKEQERVRDFRGVYAEYINATYQLGHFQLGIGSVQALLTGCESLLTIYFGSSLIIANQLSLGQLMGFIFLKQHFTGAISALLPKLAELRLMKLELERVADITLARPEIDSAGEGQVLWPRSVQGKLELKNACFRYAANEPLVLQDVSHVVEAGMTTVIVGQSGCGKSTLLKLLLGLEQAESGDVLVDGICLQQFGVRHYRQRVAAVMHKEALLAGDLSFNITLENGFVDTQRLREVCQRVNLSTLIESLPLGLNTQLGEMGSLFSAGQVQRLLLARALYREPDILIMDEALSHLGDDAGKAILGDLKKSGITVILVTHNTELLALADSVLDLSDSSRAITQSTNPAPRTINQLVPQDTHEKGHGVKSDGKDASQ